MAKSWYVGKSMGEGYVGKNAGLRIDRDHPIPPEDLMYCRL